MKKLILMVAIAVATIAATAALAAPLYGPVLQVEYSTDRPGADIQPGYPAALGTCMTACANNADCEAFTWVEVNEQPPSYDNSRPLCWLKSAVPEKHRNPGMVSGHRP